MISLGNKRYYRIVIASRDVGDNVRFEGGIDEIFQLNNGTFDTNLTDRWTLSLHEAASMNATVSEATEQDFTNQKNGA